jgi:hypothetical protein
MLLSENIRMEKEIQGSMKETIYFLEIQHYHYKASKRMVIDFVEYALEVQGEAK